MKYSKAMSLDLHLEDGIFVTPIRVYDGTMGRYVLDDIATMEVGDRRLATDTVNCKLVYFEKDDGSSGDIVALQEDRGPEGARGLNGDSDDIGPAGSRGPTGKRGVERPEGPPGKIGKNGTCWSTWLLYYYYIYYISFLKWGYS